MNNIDITIKYQNGTEFNITKDLEDKYKTDKLSLTADQLRFLIDLKNTLIERFITENKEMKEENDLLKSKLNIWENLKNEDFIPKSKIKEKIEKIGDIASIGNDLDYMYAKGQYELCKELLGKE